MNSRRGSHFRKGEVFKAYNVLKSVCMFGMAAHSKVKSSDDIIINVLETDGRSLCFGLCFHSIGNQSLHKLLRSHKTTSRHASIACPSFPYILTTTWVCICLSAKWMSGQALMNWCVIYNEVSVFMSGLHVLRCSFFLFSRPIIPIAHCFDLAKLFQPTILRKREKEGNGRIFGVRK